MSSAPRTPEALLGRNDSKNPSTTCKGITSSGRPCRRPLAAASARRRSSVGVVAVLDDNGSIANAAFYCWQHKDQAEARVQEEQNNGKKAQKKTSAELSPLHERDSIDTLVQRLGLDAAEEGRKPSRTTRPNGGIRPPLRTETRDFAQTARPAQSLYANGNGTTLRPQRPKPQARPKPNFWASLCCASSQDDDYVEIVRHRRRTQQSSKPPQNTQSSLPRPHRVPQTSMQDPPTWHRQSASSNAHTGQILSLIPSHCSPTTASALLTELAKPISDTDEDGYIYIFWLTPQSKDAPQESTARSLLTASVDRPSHARRISDVMTEYSFDTSTETSRAADTLPTRKTIMLKIGRANNVTRRMNEWQRQCGYKLNLVRWYPYVPSAAAPSPIPSPRPAPLYPDLSRPPYNTRTQSDVVRKVPFVKRVERLIHLELVEQRALQDCKACGKQHREWFEVEANQEGVKAVDECVRRWVGWAEERAGTQTSGARLEKQT